MLLDTGADISVIKINELHQWQNVKAKVNRIRGVTDGAIYSFGITKAN